MMFGHRPAHDHDHTHSHDHALPPGQAERRALIAFLLTAGFMVVEAAGGLVAGSLALLADATHMLVDALALLLAWLAFKLGRLAPDSRRSYGYKRLEVLAAFVNGLTVVALATWIGWEAVGRLMEPAPVKGWPMLVVAAAGLAVNLVVLRTLGHDHGSLNLRGAALHVLGDLLGSTAAVAGAVVILLTGWTPVDPLLSLAVAVLILFSAWRLVRSSTHILLEGTPEGFDTEAVRRRLLERVPGLADVHHLHAWSLTSGQPLATLHARLADGGEAGPVLGAIKAELTALGVAHSVVQVERGDCPDEHGRCA